MVKSPIEHPGKKILEKLEETGMTQRELAIRTDVSEKHVWTVINGDKNISSSFARKLGYVFENMQYWLTLQNEFDEYTMTLKEKNEISEEEISILKNLHEIIQFYIEHNFMHNQCSDVDKVLQLRDLLGVSKLTIIPNITYNAAYRAQLSNDIKTDPYVLFAWQRLCELQTIKIEVAKKLDIALLESKLEEIKSLMFSGINDGIHEIQSILSECGIAFSVVKNFRGAPVQGFIKQINENKLILCLTIRGKRADSFWFTLFHEIGHILNEDYSTRFVDFDSVESRAEKKANDFAKEILIPTELYGKFIRSFNGSWYEIENFADQIKVKPFIILGRLQNDKILDWSDYADKVARYDWA